MDRDQDNITWKTAGVRLGTSGLDLREPSDPGALTKLVNARFADDRTVEERDGYLGTLVQDSATFAPVGITAEVGDWVYGHGRQLKNTNAASWENAHHPIPGRGQATFEYDGHNVVWTGDRLLVVKDGGSLGASNFWQRNVANTADLAYGLPAHLPLQTDTFPPAAVTGNYVETCLTSQYRCYLHTDTGGALTAWVINRSTGAIVNKSEISGASNNPAECKVINSAEYLVALWRDATSNQLYMNYWTGSQWNGAASLQTSVGAFDVATVPGGFHVAVRFTTNGMAFTQYAGIKVTTANYAQWTNMPNGSNPPALACGIAVAPDGGIGAIWESASSLGLCAAIYNKNLVLQDSIRVIDALTGWTNGVSICARGLKEADGKYKWVTHASRNASAGVEINHLRFSFGSLVVGTPVFRYNSTLASKSFRVGDEVFCWLRSNNAGTHYLIAGAGQLQVVGFADREEAIARTAGGNYGIPHVLADPSDTRGASFTWARPFNTGQTYSHGGNVRIGDIDFLPPLSSVQYGLSRYLSGSAVRNYDGIELGDAGFQDYPKVASDVQATGGSLTNTGASTGIYYTRVYPVRYNKKGERFMGAAVTYGPITLTGGNTKSTLTISTLPDTNHSDVVFEVYRTETLGTAFYLEGTVANDLNAATVSFVLTMADASLRLLTGDPHAAGVGALSEVMEWGPLGCSILATAGDRLWGAGGQVTAGEVQFSKLKEPGEGAGFDDLAGFQVVDSEGGVITSVHPQQDTVVVHEASQLFVVAGTGPDNYGRGSYTIPEIVLADGAVTHFGTVSTQLGTVYWGKEGPRLLTNGYAVKNISAQVRSLAETLEPSGVQVDVARQEVVWYTSTGDALLWNYLGNESRWAKWTGLSVAGCSPAALILTDGKLLASSPDAVGDDGQGFPFIWCSGNLRADQIMQGATLLRAAGVVGRYRGYHKLRMRVYYNGSPLWSDEITWDPTDKTWLSSGGSASTLTPAQVDAAYTKAHAGTYVTHRRTGRQESHYFRIEVSNIEATGKTYTPYELSLELGLKDGLGRVPVTTVSSKMAR